MVKSILIIALLAPYQQGFALEDVQTPAGLYDELAHVDPDPSEQAPAKPEESPFFYACQPEMGPSQGYDRLAKRPKVGWTTMNIPDKDSEGIQTKEFFAKLLDKIKNYIQENQNMAGNLAHCARQTAEENGNGGPTCRSLGPFIDKTVPKYIAEARYHLSLSEKANAHRNPRLMEKYPINTHLESWGQNKEVPWEPLTEEEKLKAQAILKKYYTRIEKEKGLNQLGSNKEQPFTPELSRRVMVRNAAHVTRRKHYDRYNQMMSEFPFMQFMSSAKPTRAEVASSADKIIAGAEKEKQQIEKWKKMLSVAGTDYTRSLMSGRSTGSVVRGKKNIPPELLKAMNYRHIVEAVLLENPQYSGVAASAMEVGMNREIGQAVALGLPLMAASFFAPPLAAVAAGVAMSGMILYEDIQRKEEARLRSLNQVYGDAGTESMQELAEMDKVLVQDALLTPLQFMGVGLAGKSLRAGKSLLQTSERVYQSIGAIPKTSGLGVLRKFRNTPPPQ